MAGRQNKRAGFGTLKGATSPAITISLVAPPYPRYKEIWIYADPAASKMYWWSGTAWIQVTT
jgi:hypothetical protein